MSWSCSTIDWDKARSSTCPFSFAELAHYSRMGLDPYVVQSTKILCSKSTIPEDTERELSAAWQTQSDEYPGEDNAREILLGLVASKQGSVFAGICTAINKYYHRLGR